MSTRDENHEWLIAGAERRADGWEADMIKLYGMEGALDLLAIQGGTALGANLTRRPFSGNQELKDVIREAREVTSRMSQLAYAQFWADLDAIKEARVKKLS